MASCCRRYRARRLKALGHDPQLLVIGPAPPAASLHHLKPFKLSTALMAVHKDCYAPIGLSEQGGPCRRETILVQHAANPCLPADAAAPERRGRPDQDRRSQGAGLGGDLRPQAFIWLTVTVLASQRWRLFARGMSRSPSETQGALALAGACGRTPIVFWPFPLNRAYRHPRVFLFFRAKISVPVVASGPKSQRQRPRPAPRGQWCRSP